MKSRRKVLAVLLAAGAALAIFRAVPADERPGEPASRPATRPADSAVRVTLLHVNDVHGRLEPFRSGGKNVGGYARFKTLVDEVRATEGADRVLLVHAGDEFSKGDELTQRSKGAANVDLMNLVRFDVWTPGNGEFYGGLDNLRARIRQAKCDVLAANVAPAAGGEAVGKPFVVRRAGPIRVGLLGLCFVHADRPGGRDVVLTRPIDSARKLVPDLRKQSDVVVAVTHVGLLQDVALAGAVGGIDLIIGGHSHAALPKGQRLRGPDGRDVLICQAGSFLKYVGRVDLTFRPEGEGYRLTESNCRLIPLDEKVRLDPAVTAKIAALSEAPASQPAGARQ